MCDIVVEFRKLLLTVQYWNWNVRIQMITWWLFFFFVHVLVKMDALWKFSTVLKRTTGLQFATNVQLRYSSQVFHAQECPTSHTASAISTGFEQMLGQWNITKEKVQVVIKDNACNIAKAMGNCQLGLYGTCFIANCGQRCTDSVCSSGKTKLVILNTLILPENKME